MFLKPNEKNIFFIGDFTTCSEYCAPVVFDEYSLTAFQK